MMRDSTSRPSESVPSRCPAVPGGANVAAKSVWSGAYGASTGANTATRTATTRTTRPVSASGARSSRRSTRLRRGALTPVGGRSATAASTVVMLAPSRRFSGDADAWVDDRVEQVHEQVDDDVRRRRHQHDSLDHRVVALEDRVDRQLAEAGQTEDPFGDDGAGDQRAELQADDRDDDDQAVAQGVHADDRPFVEPL